MNLPIYSQLPNCCGLSTFLMLINPEYNIEFKQILERIYRYVADLKKVNKPEFRWQVVLNYILLRSFGDNLLRDFLKRKIPNIVNYYIPIALYELLGNNFNLSDLYSPRVFLKSLYKMRTDVDLKILFTLFGGSFEPQPQVNLDGTGSLYFVEADFEDDNLGFKEKMKIIERHLHAQKRGINACIALNKSRHWVAINNLTLDDKALSINNPLGGREILDVKLGIPESFRFYFFKYSTNNAFILGEKASLFLTKSLDSWI
ncbi:MAG: hypothetical protein GF317_05345 [Candidatus Lokiarchaeota archaeon]|nr:hypothetical protein [Candidatus Lokiarchaeota archaeon]MBD3199232.1 hypothetical protein [Candidatus Lokiarchaeota archaeon]